MSTDEITLEQQSRITVGVPKETFPGERRVAVVPATILSLTKAGCDVFVESGAGDEAGFPDSEYTQQGATLIAQRSELFPKGDSRLLTIPERGWRGSSVLSDQR